jgi:hypothetical protein
LKLIHIRILLEIGRPWTLIRIQLKDADPDTAKMPIRPDPDLRQRYLLVQVETCGDYAKCPICQKNIKSTFIIRHIKSHDFPTIILKVGVRHVTGNDKDFLR